jgi:hypothetical protein
MDIVRIRRAADLPTDLAIDYSTGDLKISPTKDIDVRTGLKTVEQRIRVRLRIIQGAWSLDPTNGTLGSRLREIFRMPSWRAVGELELVIREALEPMDDLRLQRVNVTIDDKDKRILHVLIGYAAIEEGDEETDVQTLETTVVTAG